MEAVVWAYTADSEEFGCKPDIHIQEFVDDYPCRVDRSNLVHHIITHSELSERVADLQYCKGCCCRGQSFGRQFAHYDCAAGTVLFVKDSGVDEDVAVDKIF